MNPLKIASELTPLQILTIRDDPNSQNWYVISFNYNLSEDFINEFNNYISWELFVYQELPINIIDKFSHKFDKTSSWRIISSFHNLTKPFIEKYADKLSFNHILLNPNIQNDIKDYCRMFL